MNQEHQKLEKRAVIFMEIGMDLLLPKLVTIQNTVIAFFLLSWHSKSSCLFLSAFFIHISHLLVCIFHSVMEYLWSEYPTSTSESHNIVKCFFGTPFSWVYIPCRVCREIMMPTQPCIYVLCFLALFLLIALVDPSMRMQLKAISLSACCLYIQVNI